MTPKKTEKGKREEKKETRDLKILTAILLGKNKNKDLAEFLDTDKSYASKKVRDLEKQGLVDKKGEGKDVIYEVNKFNFTKFLQSKVVIKSRSSESEEE